MTKEVNLFNKIELRLEDPPENAKEIDNKFKLVAFIFEHFFHFLQTYSICIMITKVVALL